jgi:hypothetical protein
MSIFIPGMDFLASTKLASAAQLTATLTFPPRDILMVIVMITGYSGSDVASLRFGTGSGVDTANNYMSRYVSFATGSGTGADNINAGVALVRLGIATANSRSAFAIITNPATTQKVVNCHSMISGGTTAAAVVTSEGGGVWNNTTAQITQMNVSTAGGSITMNAGSGLMVFGRNF